MACSTSVLGSGLFDDAAFDAVLDTSGASRPDETAAPVVDALADVAGDLAAFVAALIVAPVVEAARRDLRAARGLRFGSRS